MKIRKLQNLKKKIDRIKEMEAEEAIIQDIQLILAKSEALGNTSAAMAFLMLREKGYKDVQLVPLFFKIGKRAATTTTVISYRGMMITSDNVKPIPKHSFFNGMKIPFNEGKEVAKEVMFDSPGVDNVADRWVLTTLENGHLHLALEEPEFLDFKEAMRGYAAEGHAVHRLVARSHVPLTYEEAKTVLRTHPMNIPEVFGLSVKFATDGNIATVY